MQSLKKLSQEINLDPNSTLTQHGLVSGAAWIASADVAIKDKFLDELSASELMALPYLFEFWALPRIGPAKRAFDDPTYRHQTHSFSGIGLRPYRPCHLTVKAGDGGLDITWIRRGRIDADPWSETEIPLGETFEHYRVRIISGGQVLREHLVDAPAWQYSKEHQDTDNPNGENLPIWLDVAQLSERFGVGPSAGIKLS